MFGEKRKLTTMQCCVCRKFVALRVDRDDIERHKKEGVFVQHADRNGKPYLTPHQRELFLSGVCKDCWHALCPSDPMAYN